MFGVLTEMRMRLRRLAVSRLARLLDDVLNESRTNTLGRIRRNINVDIHSSFRMDLFTNLAIDRGINQLTIKEGVVCMRYCNFMMYKNASLIINKNVFFNNLCSINCLGTIEIGENTLFGEAVKLYDHNHEYTRLQNGVLQIEPSSFSIGSIRIGRNCWIASNVTILSNVEIGDNVVIGANNLIYRSVPSNSVVKAKLDAVIS